MASTKEYRLRVYYPHGSSEITVMNGQWQDFAGATRDQRVVEEGKPDKWKTRIEARQWSFEVLDEAVPA